MSVWSAGNGMVIERLSDLPSESIDALVAESEQAGWRFMRRLAEEWASGANRFDGAGEGFFAALIGGRVVGVCGLNVDPYTVAQAVGRCGICTSCWPIGASGLAGSWSAGSSRRPGLDSTFSG